ncbi:Lysine 2,3-aminomutase [Chitinispirillum alkaliphilum]|nr:Lysine 2,3-aminomutase [Chitinispirillum alkaliphilum]
MISTSSLISASKEELIDALWRSDSKIFDLLSQADTLEKARSSLFSYLCNLEQRYFHSSSPKNRIARHIIERNNAKECIRVFKNIIFTENEHITSFSALNALFLLAKNDKETIGLIKKGFLCEFIFLFRGINAKSQILSSSSELKVTVIENKDALSRSNILDQYSSLMNEKLKSYKTGTDKNILKASLVLKKKILNHFNATEEDWNNYTWHISNIIRDYETIQNLVSLNDKEMSGLKYAQENNIPIHITPYYLSLFSETKRQNYDRTLRAQVIPSSTYCKKVIENLSLGLDHDFMGEKSTSPIQHITRRYAKIVILKPFDSCPQICVYCQRNWEITEIENANFTKASVDNAIDWIKNNKYISEVLVTGGDPLTLTNEDLDDILGKIAQIKHVKRIRIGTRMLVTIPMRFTPEFISVLKKYHEWGKREISIMTHVEDALEITADTLAAIKLIKNAGMNIYNQQVYTYYNSRRYESCFLRKELKISGIDPYYLFNTKGKEETVDFRVPIARIEQEKKEEARLLPGLERTDESVFNVPKLGKSHLRAMQDHEPIMILPDGKRIYRFYPWESKLILADDYLYTDVSIFEYLEKLKCDGENVDEYQSIWYYF